MAHSLAIAGEQPDGTFEQASSGTRFESRGTATGVWQSFERHGESGKLKVEYAIGSGSHAVGYLAEVGDRLFQSPLSYYTSRRMWDVAPGYEQTPEPDFSRPVTVECLTCHADKPLPLIDTLNGYQVPPFAGMSIQCDRCHGPVEAHLRKPIPGSIINPAKLAPAARDSICEQCHLAGQTRIPDAGKAIADFRPGERVEDVFTVYVTAHSSDREIKVVSHSEQLALSACARNSGGKLWCGTCHNPHDKPDEPAVYYRERCLTCHAAKLARTHGLPDRNCVGCHMPRRPAKDGGHTAFTDHRITRHIEPEGAATQGGDLTAWREPAPEVRKRNLAMALATEGIQSSVPAQVIRGYRMLNRMDLKDDAAALTVLGSVLLTAKEPREAERRFARALALRPNYAPYEVNLAEALVQEADLSHASEHLERALALDPLLQNAVRMLEQVYRAQGQATKASQIIDRYKKSMGISD